MATSKAQADPSRAFTCVTRWTWWPSASLACYCALVATEWLDKATLTRTLRTDGPLAIEWFNPQTVLMLDAQVWGQGFDAPVFCDEVQVLQQRLVGEKHMKLRLRHQGQDRDAIWFGHADPLPATVRLAYRINVDEWNGKQRVQMVVEAAV